MNDDKRHEMYEAFNRALNKVTSDQLLWGNWIQDERVTITSTATDQPQTRLTKEDLFEALKLIKKGDSLQQKGIGREWVCVINPRLVNPIKDVSAKYITVPKYVMPPFELDYIMGRRVFIINEAPLNIEYMEEKIMHHKYAKHFKRDELQHVIARLELDDDESE